MFRLRFLPRLYKSISAQRISLPRHENTLYDSVRTELEEFAFPQVPGGAFSHTGEFHYTVRCVRDVSTEIV
jgi:hypothetical protein